MKMKGGNTAELYQGDGRLRMSRALERAWPYVVETKRRFGRPQHHVRYQWRKFDAKLVLRQGVDLTKILPSEFGMQVTQVEGEVRSPALRELLAKAGKPATGKAPTRRASR